MLRHRVIPLVLLDGYSVVKTINFDIRRNLGNPITVSRVYNNRNVDELILLDIDAAKQNRSIDYHTVEAVAEQCFMPLTVGGGLRSCNDISKTLEAGADKVSLNSILFEDFSVIKEAVAMFGSQCIVASLDIKKNGEGQYELYSHAKKANKMSLEQCLDKLNDAHVGEILVNNVDLEGTMKGFDIDLVRLVAEKAHMPVIATGGASSAHDCSKVIAAGAQAVAAASIFHFTSITPQLCKEDMNKNGIAVRLN